MVPEHPLNRISLISASAAEDLSFAALADISAVINSHPGIDIRLIGGNMVSLHVQRWALGESLYRLTQDADIGVTRLAITQGGLIDGLLELGYERLEGNRYIRKFGDTGDAVIDIMVPAYTSRARDNITISPQLTTTEVRGLADAFRQEALIVEVELHRRDGHITVAAISLPDETSSLILKAFAWNVRSAATDAVDMWRLLEVAFVAGLSSVNFTSGSGPRASQIIREAFVSAQSSAMQAIRRSQGINSDEAQRRFTRISALIHKVLG